MLSPRIIVTMTSWKKRINSVHLVIDQFLKNQTIKPDIFYLWLSEEEFSNKENDLPAMLITVCRMYNVKIQWTLKNDKCFKRWNVYPKHWNDYVVSIDDDSWHSPTLIEDAILQLQKCPLNTICNIWWQFSAIPQYDNDAKIKFNYDFSIDPSAKIWACATCVIPPNTFPLEAIADEIKNFVRQYLLTNDESWLISFFLKNDIKITFIHKNFQYITLAHEKETGLHNYNMGKLNDDGYKNTEKTLYIMLNKLNLLKKYMELHKGYNYNDIQKCINLQV